jgi:undecaprenyl-phosphate galactose phosphotransferase
MIPEKASIHKTTLKGRYAYLLLPILLMILDYCAVVLAEQLSFILRNMLIKKHGVLRITWLHFYIICPALYLAFLNICQLYTRQMQFWRVIAGIFKANLYAILTGVLLMYVVQIAGTTSRLYTGMLWILTFFFIVLFRYILKTVAGKISWMNEPVLLMGAGKTAEILLEHITKEPGISYRFIGFLEDYEPNPVVAAKLPRLGMFAEAAEVIRKTGVQKVMVIAPGLNQQKIQDIVYELQPLVKNISFIPDMGTLPLATMDLESLVDGHIVMFRLRNNLKNKWNRTVKFVFDWIATLLGGIVIAPVFLLISLWIKLDSPGPAIFKQKRIGQHGREFYCYKFRTMCVDAQARLDELLETDEKARQEWKENFKLKDDPRITHSGKFLRSTSLDELPQIFNVLKGEMSLVGPRPIISQEIHYYGKFIEDYYMVRPGITGRWQTSGRSDTGYERRVQMDTWYVRNWDFWFDIVLLWRTMKVVIQQKGAY